MRTTRRTTTGLLALAAAAGAALTTGTTSPVQAAPVTAPVTQTAPAASSSTGAPKTRITYTVDHCEGCQLILSQIAGRYAKDYWNSPTRTVHDGSVSFVVSQAHTHGLQASISAPWETRLGYATFVVARYHGQRPGDDISVATASDKTRGSRCWSGTDQKQVTIPLTVRKVPYREDGRRHNATVAFATTTLDWMRPMEKLGREGILGAQDYAWCGHEQ